MTAASASSPADIPAIMADMGRKARAAARLLATAPGEAKSEALLQAAALLRARADDILAANAKDLAAGEAKGLSASLMDRLALDAGRIDGVAKGLETIAAAPDPVGDVMAEWERPNGLKIARVRTPLGVVAVIYESRPNVTADAGGLCLKAGNAAILRGGSESFHSSTAIHACLADAIAGAGLPKDAVQLVPVTDRAAVGELLSGLDGNIDIIVPRGGRSLVERVQADARAPVFGHLEGLCHVYVDKDADLDKAEAIVVNAKMRRPGICGAAETLLIDKARAGEATPRLVGALIDAGCAVRGDEAASALDERVTPAEIADWRTEYLAPIISIRIVEGVDGAISHIAEFGSGHTESVITENAGTAERFLTLVDSAIVMHNASTQFADGGEFGTGAEIGIATGRIHARGPVGAEQLTSYKYVVRGTGQTRP